MSKQIRMNIEQLRLQCYRTSIDEGYNAKYVCFSYVASFI